MTKPAYQNIALSGDVGTGTTTLGRNLASTLDWQHVNAGDYFRAYHRERGIPLEKTKEIPEEVDRQLDGQFADDMAVQTEKVFESHLAGWLARDTFLMTVLLPTPSPPSNEINNPFFTITNLLQLKLVNIV